MDELKFQIGKISQLDEIFCIYQAAIQEMKNQIPQWDKYYPTKEDLLNDINQNELYVGIYQNKISSVFVLNNEYDQQYNDANWKNPDIPYTILHRLCVNPSFQNIGLGRRTVMAIENKAKQLGFGAIRLDVFTLNPYALSLYKNLGYTEVGKANFRKGLFLLMEKYL